MSVARFGVSLEEELLEALDHFVLQNNFPNRSRALRHLVEKYLVEQKWQCNHEVAGSVVLLYPVNLPDVGRQILEMEQEYSEYLLGSQRFIADKNNVLEVVSVRGPSFKLTEFSDRLISVKGVHHGKLLMSRLN
jgi:CopG family nickel-responsive transcriptional regulator